MAYNLVTLHDQLVRYTSFEDDDFVLRMEANEAAIYGQRALNLLHEAKSVLCEKYAVQIPDRVVVEIFPQQKDFAIRTFGMPGGSGYLGVCFGRLITANSPASQGSSPSNWQAVLWHEFCHVVTLEKTKNRMPRWLSEGISVYEERQRQAGWGEQMTPQYREMILGEELTPVSQLSGAFLRPKSPVHLQFAYYESSLVVEYLIERYGLEILQRILDDLGAGLPINETLQRYTGSIDALDAEFAKYARERAHQVAPDLDFHREALPAPPTLVSLDILLKKQPNNYWALKQKAQLLMEAEQWSAAKEILKRLHQAYPQDPTSGNATLQLAKLYGEIDDVDSQRKMLQAAVDLDADNVGSLQALAELQAAGQDWPALAETCERIIAVNPFLSQPHTYLATAAQATDRPDLAVLALQAKVQLDPVDPAGNYFALADSLTKAGRTKEAKRQVLKALELAPRYFEAQQLLLNLSSSDEQSSIESSEPVVEPRARRRPAR
ncbi:MAG: hypothetical protein KDA87_23530, partial [Planctomycetales bacterium]|nr:hypothetical protein [Planctomycetales bacterium]